MNNKYDELLSSVTDSYKTHLSDKQKENGRVTTDAFNKLLDEAKEQTSSYNNPSDFSSIAAAIDTIVNRKIKYGESLYERLTGRDDWQTPLKTANRGQGDCEDIALIKVEMMKKMGIPDDRIGVMIFGNKDGKGGHATAYFIDDKGEVNIIDNDAPKSSALVPLKEYLNDNPQYEMVAKINSNGVQKTSPDSQISNPTTSRSLSSEADNSWGSHALIFTTQGNGQLISQALIASGNSEASLIKIHPENGGISAPQTATSLLGQMQSMADEPNKSLGNLSKAVPKDLSLTLS